MHPEIDPPANRVYTRFVNDISPLLKALAQENERQRPDMSPIGQEENPFDHKIEYVVSNAPLAVHDGPGYPGKTWREVGTLLEKTDIPPHIIAETALWAASQGLRSSELSHISPENPYYLLDLDVHIWAMELLKRSCSLPQHLRNMLEKAYVLPLVSGLQDHKANKPPEEHSPLLEVFAYFKLMLLERQIFFLRALPILFMSALNYSCSYSVSTNCPYYAPHQDLRDYDIPWSFTVSTGVGEILTIEEFMRQELLISEPRYNSYHRPSVLGEFAQQLFIEFAQGELNLPRSQMRYALAVATHRYFRIIDQLMSQERVRMYQDPLLLTEHKRYSRGASRRHAVLHIIYLQLEPHERKLLEIISAEGIQK